MTSPNILFVDDQEATRYVVEKALTRGGFRVVVAASAEAALPLLSNPLDLALLDVNLPGMSGLELCRVIRADPRLHALPVIHLSATSVEWDDRVRGLEGGADAYMTHPVEPPVLLATVRALLRARAAEARYRRMVEANIIGVIGWSAAGAVTDANEAFLHMLGFTRDDLEAGRIDWRALSPPEYRTRDEAVLQRALQTGSHPPYEKEFVASDGRRVPVVVGGATYENEPERGVAFVLDVTPLKQAQQEREEALAREQAARRRAEAAQRRMAFLLEVTGLLLAEPRRLREGLQGLARLCAREVAGCCLIDLHLPHAPPERLCMACCSPEVEEAGRVLAARPPVLERGGLLAGVVQSGQPAQAAAAATPLEPARDPAHAAALAALGVDGWLAVPLRVHARVLGVLALGLRGAGAEPVDVTLAEEVGHRAAVAIESALLYEQVTRALQAREDTLATVSHDLRNPLSNVVLASGQLRRALAAGDVAKAERQVGVVQRAADTMNRLVGDLLDLARLEAGRATLTPERARASVVLHDAVEAQRLQAQEKGVRLEAEPMAEDPEVWCDPVRVRQVLGNLVGNALKFTAPGGAVVLGASRAGCEAVFSVRDTGQGMKPEQLPHIFERYWQARPAGQGVGLGLSIVKGIVEAHGGRIWADSVEGRGTTFWFTLPLAPKSG
ncbi:MAG TPA: ATP-binding protein [Anaeromyxobacteraceae bacterium]|nr:ATP-binding protein [Anaeromyxobacteraceae bacterium]